MLYEMILIINL